MPRLFDRYSFVAVTTTDLGRAREFWVEVLGLPVKEEEPGHYFIVDAGGLRLCVDTEDGDLHRPGGTDPVIGFRVASLERTLAILAMRRVLPERGPITSRRGNWAMLRDPDGRPVVLSESD
ncbi:MAG: VOC family protein [Planctomycetes bacterium]|nr:VOC family protein [Planctomycetota bacterium]